VIVPTRSVRSSPTAVFLLCVALAAGLFATSASAAAPIGQIKEFSSGLNPGSFPDGIATGPDGALWFTTGGKSVGRITTAGVVTTFIDPVRMRGTYGIAAGPDGALWFTNYLGSSIGRISVDGTVTTYTGARIRYPVGITAGPDGALWFTDYLGNSIGRVEIRPPTRK